MAFSDQAIVPLQMPRDPAGVAALVVFVEPLRCSSRLSESQKGGCSIDGR